MNTLINPLFFKGVDCYYFLNDCSPEINSPASQGKGLVNVCSSLPCTFALRLIVLKIYIFHNATG